MNADALTGDERQVLCEMSDEVGFSAGTLARWTGLSVKAVRAAHRSLHQSGLAEFGPLFSEDDGRLMGRGYWLNGRGYDVRCIGPTVATIARLASRIAARERIEAFGGDALAAPSRSDESRAEGLAHPQSGDLS